MAKHQDGYWFKQGQRIKSALIKEIGGCRVVVRVTVEGYDKYDRVLGIVTCDGRDIGEWLGWNGYAIAAFVSLAVIDAWNFRRLNAAQRGMWAPLAPPSITCKGLRPAH